MRARRTNALTLLLRTSRERFAGRAADASFALAKRASGASEHGRLVFGHENGSRGLLLWLGPLGSGDRDRGSQGERVLGRPIVGRWALEPGLFSGRPCDLSGCAASADPSVSFAHGVSRSIERVGGGGGSEV